MNLDDIKPLTHFVNVRMTEDDSNRLAKLSKQLGVKPSGIIRKSLRTALAQLEEQAGSK